jgi:hypothetical protein
LTPHQNIAIAIAIHFILNYLALLECPDENKEKKQPSFPSAKQFFL